MPLVPSHTVPLHLCLHTLCLSTCAFTPCALAPVPSHPVPECLHTLFLPSRPVPSCHQWVRLLFSPHPACFICQQACSPALATLSLLLLLMARSPANSLSERRSNSNGTSHGYEGGASPMQLNLKMAGVAEEEQQEVASPLQGYTHSKVCTQATQQDMCKCTYMRARACLCSCVSCVELCSKYACMQPSACDCAWCTCVPACACACEHVSREARGVHVPVGQTQLGRRTGFGQSSGLGHAKLGVKANAHASINLTCKRSCGVWVPLMCTGCMLMHACYLSSTLWPGAGSRNVIHRTALQQRCL